MRDDPTRVGESVKPPRQVPISLNVSEFLRLLRHPKVLVRLLPGRILVLLVWGVLLRPRELKHGNLLLGFPEGVRLLLPVRAVLVVDIPSLPSYFVWVVGGLLTP